MKRPSSLTTSIDIEASAAQVWDVVGNGFGKVAEITSVLNASHLDGPLEVGSARVCINAQNQRISERLTQFDPAQRVLAYDGDDGFPSWITKASNHWEVKALGPNAARLTLSPDIDVKWWIKPILPLMGFGVRKILDTFLREVKHYCETGNRHPNVVKHHAKLAAKSEAQAV